MAISYTSYDLYQELNERGALTSEYPSEIFLPLILFVQIHRRKITTVNFTRFEVFINPKMDQRPIKALQI